MPIDLTIREAQPKTKKRFTAIFRLHKGGKVIKITHFGQRNPKYGTYIDHKDKEKRKNYIARHEVREKRFYKNPQRAATLSRYILWGPEDTLIKSIEYYKKKFNLS
jgi:hypothetical protein